jgi:CRP/FNR family cyclic AMP-dependent transcriptional regulator
VDALLRGTRLFAGLDDGAITELSLRSRLRRYARGETVFVEGDPGDCLFAVASGLVKVFVSSARGEELVLATLQPGETFGELSLLDGSGRSASAEAVEASRLLVVDRRNFVDLLRSRPELIDRLLRTFGALVRRLTEQAGDLAFLDMQGRVAKLLLQLTGEGSVTPREAGVDIPFSQTDLASMVGSSRQTVNQILRSFQAAGYIDLRGRRLKILRADALQHRAAD